MARRRGVEMAWRIFALLVRVWLLKALNSWSSSSMNDAVCAASSAIQTTYRYLKDFGFELTVVAWYISLYLGHCPRGQLTCHTNERCRDILLGNRNLP